MYLNIVSVGTVPHAGVILSPLPLSPPCLVEPFPPGSTVAGDSHLLLSHIAHSEASGNGLSLKPAGNVSLLTSTRQSGVWIALDGVPYRKIVLCHARAELCQTCSACRLEQQTVTIGRMLQILL